MYCTECGATITDDATICEKCGSATGVEIKETPGKSDAKQKIESNANNNKSFESNIKNENDITEYYTAEEIAQKYKVNAKWVWTYTRQHKVPKVRIRQFNYYSKKHIDAAFAKYEVDSDLTEWYTPEDIQEKYGMTRVAIRSHVYRNNIPSKKEHGQIFYSKLHFDLSKNSAEESKAEYYTVKEAMEKFKLSRDSVYNILQFHQISREKNGRFVRFLKVDFDRVMGVRK
jgi:hypothetical protein